ncbi:MAG: VanZ family protein [Firmicutes bacterium]|nr:VanZ family protein [Bacillota bacterium]
MRRPSVWFILLIGLCVSIYFLTALPVFADANTMRFFLWTGLPPIMADIIDFIVRKLTHATLFAGLAFIAFQALKPARWDYLLAWGFATLYGATDEWHQLYVMGRTGSSSDVLIDSAGAFLILLLVYRQEIKRSRRNGSRSHRKLFFWS